MKSMGYMKIDKGELIEILAYLTTSAELLINEPHIYGPLRLLEAANRLIEMAESKGIDIDDLRELKQKINEAIEVVIKDEEKFKETLKEIGRETGKIVKQLP